TVPARATDRSLSERPCPTALASASRRGPGAAYSGAQGGGSLRRGRPDCKSSDVLKKLPRPGSSGSSADLPSCRIALLEFSCRHSVGQARQCPGIVVVTRVVTGVSASEHGRPRRDRTSLASPGWRGLLACS